MSLGARYLGGGRCQFHVWAPFAQKVAVHLLAPQERLVPMERAERGYYQAVVDGVEPASLYVYRLDKKKERPDPASRSQPHRATPGPQRCIASFVYVASV